MTVYARNFPENLAFKKKQKKKKKKGINTHFFGKIPMLSSAYLKFLI